MYYKGNLYKHYLELYYRMLNVLHEFFSMDNQLSQKDKGGEKVKKRGGVWERD